MKTFLMLLPLVALVACASTLKVREDHDVSANFTRLRSYQWLPVTATAAMAMQTNGFLDARVRNAVDAKLQTMGYAFEEQAPDFYVNYHVAAREKVDVTQWGYRPYGRAGNLSVTQYTEGTLIIDVIDARSMQLIWRGTAQGTVDPDASTQEREKGLREAVGKTLAQFPSRSQG